MTLLVRALSEALPIAGLLGLLQVQQ
jgi:hypothetical protein